MRVFQRVIEAAVTVWLAATLAFVALRVLPGDAIESQLRQVGADAVTIAERRAALGLSDTLAVQYVRYLAGLLRGDLGDSLLTGQPVSEMIAQQLPPTLALACGALVTATMLGMLLGCAGGLDLMRGVSAAARAVISLSLATPIYWTGTVAIFVFSVWLNVLFSAEGELILPVALLGFHASGAIGRVTLTNVRAVQSTDFVRTARAKGLPERWVVLHHLLRAALLPTVTVVALQAGFLLGGTVITESLFVRPGIGRLLLESTLRQDYPVVQGIVVMAAVVYVLVGMAADIAYRLLDPRVAA